MRCLILDDEEPARRELVHLLSLHPQMKVVGQAGDVETALKLTEQVKPDVVFLDIQLAGETGFDYVAALGEPLPRLVFITAHDRYAIRGFECNALDYILKPVHPERLEKTLHRLGRIESPQRRAEEDDVVFLKAASIARFAPWKEVHHIVSAGNYTRVFLNNGTALLIARSLKRWQGLVPPGLFLQVHRTTLVRRDVLRELHFSNGRRELVLSDGVIVPVGRAYWTTLKTLT